MITVQRFVQLAQADAAPSATLPSTRIHLLVTSGLCGRLHERAICGAVPAGLDECIGLTRRQNCRGYQTWRGAVAGGEKHFVTEYRGC